MPAKRVLSLFQKGWTAIIDPGREERLARGTSLVHRDLSNDRDEFDLGRSLTKHELTDEDAEEIARRIFQKCLVKAWSDEAVSPQEQRTLMWVAKRLRIGPDTAKTLQQTFAEEVFASALGEAFQDGQLEDSEFARLERIAGSCGATAGAFFRSRFRETGEDFLRTLLLRVLEDGTLDEREWRGITAAVAKLGMSEAEFKETVRGPAEQYVEHLLADFKSDGELSKDEQRCLDWLLSNLIGRPEFIAYVKNEVQLITQESQIRRGILPTVTAPTGTPLRAGEIAHLVGNCIYTSSRHLAAERAESGLPGQLVVTDDRIIFASQVKSYQVIHRKVLGYRPVSMNQLEIQCSGVGAGSYEFSPKTRFALQIWIAAIQKANQTLVSPSEGVQSRHIPRDVRQRVWQRCGGRCVECSSTQYLEFDHIIPHSRGGSNADGNVQLLCRGCNGRKSDHI